jgi:hypothetical protein
MSNSFPNRDWNLADEKGNITTWEKVGIAVLLDIRQELRTLNGILKCPNFLAIPRKLEAIRRNTVKKRKAKP